jgi:hypothetical protein
MELFCDDRDLLRLEPGVFAGGGFAAQHPAAGTHGQLDGTSFTAADADFVSAGLAAGMVLTAWTVTPADGRSLEITGVTGPTELAVSLLRTGDDDPPQPAPAAGGLRYRVRTFRPRIAEVSATLAEKLRQLAEAAGICRQDFADSAQLRRTAALGVLAGSFLARADGTGGRDANWRKAGHYRAAFREAQLQLRLAADPNGDGRAESDRTLGNILLRRV